MACLALTPARPVRDLTACPGVGQKENKAHTISDIAVTIHHSSDWSGEARVVGAIGGEIHVDGTKLVRGLVNPADYPDFPAFIIVRATALAVQTFMLDRAIAAVESVGIDG